MDEPYYTIGSLARFVGVHVKTIKRWVAEGKIPEPQRDARNRRVWDANQARRVMAYRQYTSPTGRSERIRLRPGSKGRIT